VPTWIVVPDSPRPLSGAGLPGPQILPRSPKVPAGTAEAVFEGVFEAAAGGPAGLDERPHPARASIPQKANVAAVDLRADISRSGIGGFYANS
jgi:hypothetical protein